MIMAEKFKVDMYDWNFVLHFMSFWNICILVVDFRIICAEYFSYVVSFLITILENGKKSLVVKS